MNKTYFFLLFLLLFFSSCLSLTQSKAQSAFVPYGFDAGRQKLEELTKKAEYEKAIQLLSSFHFSSEERDSLQSIFSENVRHMQTNLAESYEKEDYATALRWLRSLKAIGVSPDFDEQQILWNQARALLREGKITPAAILLQKEVDVSALEEDDWLLLMDRFVGAGLQSDANYIFSLLASKQIRISKEAQDFAQTKPPFSLLITGTVTVWLDRGIKVENRMGIPDRIIGSGFYIDDQGHILTNYHLIESMVDPKDKSFKRLYIRSNEENSPMIPAKLVGWDKQFDLALLKVELKPPYVFSFQREDKITEGEPIFAIGSPVGLKNTITSGIVSMANRPILPMGDVIQIDVAVNPGNSGGPLLSQSENVIGVVFAGLPAFQGINFAIPATYAKDLMLRLYEGGKVQHHWLGLSLYPDKDGFQIIYVVPGESGFDSGLKAGDKILSLDGKKYATLGAIQESIVKNPTNNLVNLEIEREGKTINLPLRLENRPDEVESYIVKKDSAQNVFPLFLGFAAQKSYGSTFTVEKVYPGQFADELNLEKGDKVTIHQWQIDPEYRFISVALTIVGKQSGYFESTIAFSIPLSVNSLL